MGVPANHPFLDRIFPSKPSSYGSTPIYVYRDYVSQPYGGLKNHCDLTKNLGNG